ncbi:MAG: glycosyltransferase family 1 protein [Candidatus Moranbacteria bacterium]|nr:glycosyltransferase family 1 protein [Candidatus Moranbacteria bacterium]
MNQIRAIDIRLLGKKRTGDEAVFFNLTKEILALDKEHEYWLLTDESHAEVLAKLRDRLGCTGQRNVRFVTLLGKNRFVWNLLTMPWFLLRQRVDTYHTQYILPFLVPRRTKVLLHIHDVSFRAYPEFIAWTDRLFLAMFIPRSLKRANVILTPSQFTKDEIVHYYGTAPEKIAVIANAVSADFLSSNQEGEQAVRERYNLPERFIIYVGTFQPRKNIPFLIRALAVVQQRLPEVNLVLVGDRHAHHVDPAIDGVIEELGMKDRVHFPGYVDQQDLPVVMRAATLFVFPSLYEGFGMPPLEAMSQGVPVLVSDIPCLKEVAGDAALYFDPTSIASCEKKLYTLLTDNDQRVSGVFRGRDQVSFFSWRKSAATLMALYETLP